MVCFVTGFNKKKLKPEPQRKLSLFPVIIKNGRIKKKVVEFEYCIMINWNFQENERSYISAFFLSKFCILTWYWMSKQNKMWCTVISNAICLAKGWSSWHCITNELLGIVCLCSHFECNILDIVMRLILQFKSINFFYVFLVK